MLSAADFHANLAADVKLTAAGRRQHAARASALIDEIAATQARWTREKRGAALAPDAKALEAVRAKLPKQP